uniref:Uncharacterized protein n=1 Tax=Pyrodinium bahamense TaxID=73915 RepID=A0A7S0AHF7_9DINO|mmetsp:Transcript_34059/g.94241  ORF Transcript_34059/g.94241 Transcript_34059/m.94241 type:complete len:166 (+) Transcript_34059:53-550(+)
MLPWRGQDSPGFRRPGREWREIRESLEVESACPLSVWDPSAEPKSAVPAGKAPYPRVLPPPEPPLARLLPDPGEPWAPLRLAGLWGSLGAGLGVLRGVAFAAFSEVQPGFPRHRAFLMGFSMSAPWYISFFILAAVTDCYAARWQQPRMLDAAQAAGALGAGELG